MPPRPEGTDGSDHQYREKVDDLYKGLPLWRTAGWLALHFAFIPMVARLAWAFVPYYALNYPPEFQFPVMFAIYILALILWKLAKPATTKESLLLTKLTNSFVMLIAAMQVVGIYRYYLMTPEQFHFPRILWKHLSEEKGWTGDYWQQVFYTLEAFIDGGVMLSIGTTAYAFHGYITRKMALEKKLQSDKKRDAASKKDEGGDAGAPAPSSAAKPSSAARRRPGRA